MCLPRKGRSWNCGARCSATRCSKFCGACRASHQRTVMQISADQLLNHLKRGLAPIYFVYGEEQLLVEECTRAVRETAGDAGEMCRAGPRARPPADTVFVVSGGKLDKQTRETKWVKALESAGAVIAVYPPEAAQWPTWIRRRMEMKGP